MRALPLLLLLTGCATAPMQAPVSLVSPTRAITTQSSQADIRAGFAEVLAGCQQVLSGFEGQSLRAKQVAVWLQVAGAIAGAVIAPALVAASASSSLVTAFAGVSGVMNTAPTLIANEGLGAADFLASRESVRVSMQAGASRYFSAIAEGDKKLAVAAIDEMRAACVAYAVTSPHMEFRP